MAVGEISLVGLAIREVERDDLPALEWEGEFKHFRNLYRDAYQGVLRGETVMWLAELPGFSVIGQVFVSLNSSRQELADGEERAYVYGFRVRTQFRKQGIGTRLMQKVEADLAARGFRCVTLNVARDNDGARRLYTRLGYQVTAPEPGDWHYTDENGVRHNVHEPAWRMEKNI